MIIKDFKQCMRERGPTFSTSTSVIIVMAVVFWIVWAINKLAIMALGG